MLAAYPPEELEENTDADTLRFDYMERDGMDGPYDWWSEAQFLSCRFMLQAHDRGLSGLLKDLEYARERATVQRVLAERDLDRRWRQVRHARKEAAKGSSAGPGYPSGCPGFFLRSFKQRMILLLSFRLMRTSPRFAHSVPKIGKGPFSPLPDLTRVFSQAGALHHHIRRPASARCAEVS